MNRTLNEIVALTLESIADQLSQWRDSATETPDRKPKDNELRELVEKFQTVSTLDQVFEESGGLSNQQTYDREDVENTMKLFREKANELRSNQKFDGAIWNDLWEWKSLILKRALVPLIESRNLDADAAKSLLENTEFANTEVVELLGIPLPRYDTEVYEIRQRFNAAIGYLFYAPLSPYTKYIYEDYSSVATGVEPALLRKLVIQYCESRSGASTGLGDPFYWLLLATQVTQYRTASEKSIDLVCDAIGLLAETVNEGHIKDPEILVEELADLHSSRQLQGIVFELRRLVRTGKRSAILDKLIQQIWGRGADQPSVSDKKSGSRRSGSGRSKKKANKLTGEDVDELKELLESIKDTDDGGPQLKHLVARSNGISVHIYSGEGSHMRPHFHVRVRGNGGVSIALDDLSVLEGDLRGKPLRRIFRWARAHLSELWSGWEEAKGGRAPLRIDR